MSTTSAPIFTDLDDADSVDALTGASLALARRFAAGGTLWCVSPAWPEHARHVTVEFVHPVIVGTRALPAVSVVGPDHAASIREMVRPDDVVLVISTAADPVAADLVLRASAWGATTLWLASGDEGPARDADHLLRVRDLDGSAPFDGRMVLRYHLLWELTHVCFEHPGLLTEPDAGCEDDVCTTCRDEGRVGEVVGLSANGLDVDVRTAQGIEAVDVTLVGAVVSNDLVLVHAGTAIARIDSGGSR